MNIYLKPGSFHMLPGWWKRTPKATVRRDLAKIANSIARNARRGSSWGKPGRGKKGGAVYNSGLHNPRTRGIVTVPARGDAGVVVLLNPSVSRKQRMIRAANMIALERRR